MLLWAAYPSWNEMPPLHRHPGKPWNWEAFPSSPAPFHARHRPPSLHSPQSAPEIHIPHTPHHKKEHGGPFTSKTPYSSLSHKPASSNPVSGGPIPTWLLFIFSSRGQRQRQPSPSNNPCVCGGEIKGTEVAWLRGAEMAGHSGWMSIKD